jgi:glutathione S-transferase
MILVGQYDSPFVRRVAVSLHLLGIAFTRNAISVFGDAEKMARITPIVRIPSLVLDDGTVLVDSGAILDDLDHRVGPERALTPPGGPDRRRVLQIMAFATGAVDKAGTIVYERHFHPPGHVNADWTARCRGQLDGALAWLERSPAGPFFLGDRLTQGDVTTGAMLGYLKLRLPESIPPGRYPALDRLSSRLEAMEAFVKSRPGPDEVMPENV